MKKLLLVTTMLFPSFAMAGGMPRPDGPSGWNLFGINIPYHDEVCTYQHADFYYPDLCGHSNKDGAVRSVEERPVIDTPTPPKEDEDNNGGDTKDNSDTNGGDSSNDSNGGKSKDKSRDHNGGSSDDNSDDNGGDSD